MTILIPLQCVWVHMVKTRTTARIHLRLLPKRCYLDLFLVDFYVTEPIKSSSNSWCFSKYVIFSFITHCFPRKMSNFFLLIFPIFNCFRLSVSSLIGLHVQILMDLLASLIWQNSVKEETLPLFIFAIGSSVGPADGGGGLWSTATFKIMPYLYPQRIRYRYWAW